MSTINAPRWNLATIYPSFDSAEYKNDIETLKEKVAILLKTLEEPLPISASELLAIIKSFDSVTEIAINLRTYAHATYTTDTRNARALTEINTIESARLPLGKAMVMFRKMIAEKKEEVLKLIDSDTSLKDYGFFLTETIERANFQMSTELEDLANDLLRSGGDAWERLHSAISSTVQGIWDKGSGETKTVVALRDLAHDSDRNIREKAYNAELSAWKTVEIPLAASLNGVKGTAITLDVRRGWKTKAGEYAALQKSAFQSRISEKTLHALISSIEASLPIFRRYLKIKAHLLGIPVCAFYDIFAPVENNIEKKWTWEESCNFIEQQFSLFDSGMGTFARHAFEFSWLDAEIREGKIGGAYCTGFPLKGEARILCNFDGSFDAVSTVAHELGHAWHHEMLKDTPISLSQYPMTLAETASIFAQTLVFEGALKNASSTERLSLIEKDLKSSCQVIVDILSRFYFEKAVFERRSTSELSPKEFCDLMLDAQKKTYGDALDPALLHQYMWAAKSHYYRPALGFYNYPYAFGLLFSLGLYAKSPSAESYRTLLKLTGRTTAEKVASSAGFDIENECFWQDGLSIIAKKVEELSILAGL